MKRSYRKNRRYALAPAKRRRLKIGSGGRGEVRSLGFEPLESRQLLAVDFGDAPDTGAGTGLGNYNTLLIDNGPQHTIVPGLRMGASVDGIDGGVLQSAAADADDVNGALPDDEDGLVHPASDLLFTIGAQPTIRVRVTNTTGSEATLYGWIDYNADGVFDNATERASIAVPHGTNNGIVTLVFPAVPAGFTGKTYARFRLSTDAASSDPIGPAADGEVEDYQAQIIQTSAMAADASKTQKIAHNTGGGPALVNNDGFGSAVASLGDLDGDGVTDLAVGAQSQPYGLGDGGAIHILFMNPDGTVKHSQEISSGVGGGPTLADGDYFGRSLATLGDLDGDGVVDLAVGADKDDTGGNLRGSLYILFLNANGTAKSFQKIAHNTGGGPTLANGDRFGTVTANLGDLDGDGVVDLAVGANADSTGGAARGAVHILFMNPTGTVKATQKIASGTGGAPTLADADQFGSALAALGDLDGDGVSELAVGAPSDDTGGDGRGAVYVLFMNANGTVKSSQKIANGVGGGPIVADTDFFGTSTAAVGDLDGDGVTDLAVGARYDDAGGNNRGAIYLLLLNADGTAKNVQKIADGVGGGPTLSNADLFGRSVAAIGDLDGDGRMDIAVGAERDDTGGGPGSNRGALYVLFLTPSGDYDLDNDVDGFDFLAWQRSFGSIATPPGSGADGDRDGVVGAGDLDVWMAQFGTGAPASAAEELATSVALTTSLTDDSGGTEPLTRQAGHSVASTRRRLKYRPRFYRLERAAVTDHALAIWAMPLEAMDDITSNHGYQEDCSAAHDSALGELAAGLRLRMTSVLPVINGVVVRS